MADKPERKVFDEPVIVRALTKGYVGLVLREPGEEFAWPAKTPLGSWVKLGPFGGKGDLDGNGHTGGSPGPAAVDPAGVVIPENWSALPAKDKKSLAEKISGAKVANAGEADTIISTHLLTRVKPQQPFDDAPAPQTVAASAGAASGTAPEPDWVPPSGGAVAVTD